MSLLEKECPLSLTTPPGTSQTQKNSETAAISNIIKPEYGSLSTTSPTIIPPQGNWTVVPRTQPQGTATQGPITTQPGDNVSQHDGRSIATASPIITQPQLNWMVAPLTYPAQCPPGLEYLTQIDQILVHQKVDLFEVMTGFETNNQYEVKNTFGQRMYFAREQNDFWIRSCYGPSRPFGMSIFDNLQQEVMHLYRPLASQSCCCPCCLQTLEVSSPPGTVIGTIEQQWSIIYPRFRIYDERGNVVLLIKGPFCTSSCCGLNDVEFKILAPDGETEVGKICKQWGGLVREAFTDADNFGITFPLDLDVKIKAVILGACFLIDFMYFEYNKKERGG